MSIYGNLVSDTVVERKVVEALSAWLPSYLTEAARQEGFGEIAFPKSYETVRDRVTRWNEQAMPAIVVQVGGTLQIARKGYRYRVVYGCQVGAVIAGQSRQNTRQLSGIYAIAIAAALTQHGDLDGFSEGVEWTDTTYDFIDQDQSRTLMAAVVSVDVAVENVLDVSQGPAGPPPDPSDPAIPGLPDYGHVATVETESEITPIGAPL